MGLEGGKPEKKEEPSRRKFLQGFAATAALTLGSKKIWDDSDHRGKVEAKRKIDAQPKEITFLTLEKKPRQYETKRVSGMRLGTRLNLYFGTDKFGDTTDIDFKYQLASMWKKKLTLMPVPEQQKKMYLEAIEGIVASYNPEKSDDKGIEWYMQGTERAISECRTEIGWPAVARAFGLNAEKLRTLLAWEKIIDGRSLTAYAMGELLPDGSGERNVRLFETLLETGGEEYISRIPALGDRYVSSGQYQFTKFALSDAGERPVGASLMNTLLARSMIPPNVVSLQGAEHHKAAYLFALYNLAQLVKKIPEDRLRLLPVNTIRTDIRSYLTAAHHRPAEAMQAFDRFSASVVTARQHGGGQPRYATFCGEHTGPYVKKASENYAALEARTRVADRR